MEADDEALKVRVKVQRSLKEAEAQSFQLYHPQVDQAIRKKEELHKALREHREPTPEESSGHKELVTEEMLDNEMAILAPLQEGMQALPSEEVANEGARALRKVNLERFSAKLQDQYLEGVDASQALAEAMGSIQEAPSCRTPSCHGSTDYIAAPGARPSPAASMWPCLCATP